MRGATIARPTRPGAVDAAAPFLTVDQLRQFHAMRGSGCAFRPRTRGNVHQVATPSAAARGCIGWFSATTARPIHPAAVHAAASVGVIGQLPRLPHHIHRRLPCRRKHPLHLRHRRTHRGASPNVRCVRSMCRRTALSGAIPIGIGVATSVLGGGTYILRSLMGGSGVLSGPPCFKPGAHVVCIATRRRVT